LKQIRPVLDRFQDSSKTGSGINFFPTFFATFFVAFFAAFLPIFLGLLFGPAFLSMQYKSLLLFFRGWGGEGVCVEVYLRTACCCQKREKGRLKSGFGVRASRVKISQEYTPTNSIRET